MYLYLTVIQMYMFPFRKTCFMNLPVILYFTKCDNLNVINRCLTLIN